MYKVYQHKKATDDKVFYVGLAKNGTNRPYVKAGKSKHWKNIVNKHGYVVEIVSENCTKDEAKQIERYLIAYYGRICLNTGCLVNITDGGESRSGYKVNKETREKISNGMKGKVSHKRKLTDEQIIFIRNNYVPYSKQFSTVSLAKMFNTSDNTIKEIIKNRRYVI